MTPAWNNFLVALTFFVPLTVAAVAVLQGRPFTTLPATGFVTGAVLWVGFALSEWQGFGAVGMAISSGCLVGLAGAVIYTVIGGSVVLAARLLSRNRA